MFPPRLEVVIPTYPFLKTSINTPDESPTQIKSSIDCKRLTPHLQKMRFRGFLLLLFQPLFVGCTTETFAPDVAPHKLVIAETPFYLIGAAQQRPDDFLPQGTKVRLLRREMGFSLAMLEDGRVGYVANEVLADLPEKTSLATSISNSTNRRKSSALPVKTEKFEPDLPLPDIEAGPQEFLPKMEEPTKPQNPNQSPKQTQ